MEPKPEQFGAAYAETFKNQQVVEAYRQRPPYPEMVFPFLAGLVRDEPRAVLDVGAGSGDLARHLVNFVERVDAVDFSSRMIEYGRQLPQGQDPRLNWIHGKVEEAPLHPPYALITAGSSIHWTEWPLAFPRFRSILTPTGVLALVYRNTLPMPWSAAFKELRARFAPRLGSNASVNAVVELERRGWFHKQGEWQSEPALFRQTIDDFLVGVHSRSSFTREMLGEQRAAEFDRQARDLLLTFHADGWLALQVVATVSWGRPETGQTI